MPKVDAVLLKFRAIVDDGIHQKTPIHGAHKLMLEQHLRDGTGTLDMRGYKADELVLKTLHALRILDVVTAEVHFLNWKRVSQERIDEQLFGTSRKAKFDSTGKITLGVDAATKALGESIKQEEETLMWCMQMAKQLQFLLDAHKKRS